MGEGLVGWLLLGLAKVQRGSFTQLLSANSGLRLPSTMWLQPTINRALHCTGPIVQQPWLSHPTHPRTHLAVRGVCGQVPILSQQPNLLQALHNALALLGRDHRGALAEVEGAHGADRGLHGGWGAGAVCYRQQGPAG